MSFTNIGKDVTASFHRTMHEGRTNNSLRGILNLSTEPIVHELKVSILIRQTAFVVRLLLVQSIHFYFPKHAAYDFSNNFNRGIVHETLSHCHTLPRFHCCTTLFDHSKRK